MFSQQLQQFFKLISPRYRNQDGTLLIKIERHHHRAAFRFNLFRFRVDNLLI